MKSLYIDIEKWFSYRERNLSGGMGYPSSYCAKKRASGRTTRKSTLTPTIELPDELRALDDVMMCVSECDVMLLEYKHIDRGTDEQKAEAIDMSVHKFRRKLKILHCSIKLGILVSRRKGN